MNMNRGKSREKRKKVLAGYLSNQRREYPVEEKFTGIKMIQENEQRKFYL